jgi:hypothetical protein
MTPDELRLLYKTCASVESFGDDIREMKADIKSLVENGKTHAVTDASWDIRLSTIEKTAGETCAKVEVLDKAAYLTSNIARVVYVVFGSVIAALTYILAYKLF